MATRKRYLAPSRAPCTSPRTPGVARRAPIRNARRPRESGATDMGVYDASHGGLALSKTIGMPVHPQCVAKRLHPKAEVHVVDGRAPVSAVQGLHKSAQAQDRAIHWFPFAPLPAAPYCPLE